MGHIITPLRIRHTDVGEPPALPSPATWMPTSSRVVEQHVDPPLPLQELLRRYLDRRQLAQVQLVKQQPFARLPPDVAQYLVDRSARLFLGPRGEVDLAAVREELLARLLADPRGAAGDEVDLRPEECVASASLGTDVAERRTCSSRVAHLAGQVGDVRVRVEAGGWREERLPELGVRQVALDQASEHDEQAGCKRGLAA